MRTFQPINAGLALEGGWGALVLRQTSLPWSLDVVPVGHPRAARRPMPFLAQLARRSPLAPGGCLASGVFWLHPVLSPEQARGDLVRGDVVEWRGHVRTGGPESIEEVLGLVGSNGMAWRWSEPFTVRSGEELAVVGFWS